MALRKPPKWKILLLSLVFSGYAVSIPAGTAQSLAKERQPAIQEDEAEPQVLKLFRMLIFTVGVLLVAPPLLVLVPVVGLMPFIDDADGNSRPGADFADLDVPDRESEAAL